MVSSQVFDNSHREKESKHDPDNKMVRKKVVVVGLGMVGIAFMYDLCPDRPQHQVFLVSRLILESN